MIERDMEIAALPRGVDIVPLPRIIAREKWRAETLHARPHHSLIWFTRGQGQMTVAARRARFSTNTIIFVPSGISYTLDTRPGVFGHVVTMHPAQELEMPTQPILYRIRDVLKHGTFVALFEALQREVASAPDALSVRAARHHAALLGVWLERQENQLGAVDQNAGEALARRYAELIEQDFAVGSTVAALAEKLGVTATHLTRVCQATFGVSAHELLNKRVMLAARDKLRASHEPVGEISQTLGFSSPAYFSRAFQKSTGQTPSAFRKGT